MLLLSAFHLTSHQLASAPVICSHVSRHEKRRGRWPSRIIDIVPGSKCHDLRGLGSNLTRSSHDVAPKAWFEKIFDRVYKRAEGGSSQPPVNPQEIALVFIIMAQGTLFNIEMPNFDSSAEDWLHLSERALVKGEFLSNNMVTGLQTLVRR